MNTQQIHIDPAIKALRPILVYGQANDLLYRVADTDRYQDITPERVYGVLLQKAKDVLANAKIQGVPTEDGTKVFVFHFFIIQRQVIHVALFFMVLGGAIVEPHRRCVYATLRNQIGRNWN